MANRNAERQANQEAPQRDSEDVDRRTAAAERRSAEKKMEDGEMRRRKEEARRRKINEDAKRQVEEDERRAEASVPRSATEDVERRTQENSGRMTEKDADGRANAEAMSRKSKETGTIAKDLDVKDAGAEDTLQALSGATAAGTESDRQADDRQRRGKAESSSAEDATTTAATAGPAGLGDSDNLDARREELLRAIRGSLLQESGDSDLADQQKGAARIGDLGWDFIVVDCFVGDGRTPESCRSAEFIRDARTALRPGGAVLHHLWHSSPKARDVAPQYQAALAEYREVFGRRVQTFPVPRPRDAAFDDVIVARAPSGLLLT